MLRHDHKLESMKFFGQMVLLTPHPPFYMGDRYLTIFHVLLGASCGVPVSTTISNWQPDYEPTLQLVKEKNWAGEISFIYCNIHKTNLLLMIDNGHVMPLLAMHKYRQKTPTGNLLDSY